MSFEFRPAKREAVGLLLGLVGGTGSGKTYSALRLAKGICGDDPFCVIDTEAGRAKHYADRFKFDHGDLVPPFSPERYTEAILAADKAGYKAIVVDSASHEYAGEGGILDMQEAELRRMAGTDYNKREACKLASWIQPKMAHKRYVQRLLQIRAHLILCFRAEPKVDMVKNPQTNRMEIVPKKGLTARDGWFPVSEKNMPFELTASFLLVAEHPGVPLPIKLEEQHRVLFPEGQPITEAAGQRLALWAGGGVERGPAPATTDDAPTDYVPDNVLDDLTLAINEAASVMELEAIGTQIRGLSPDKQDILRGPYRARLTQLKPRRRASAPEPERVPGMEG